MVDIICILSRIKLCIYITIQFVKESGYFMYSPIDIFVNLIPYIIATCIGPTLHTNDNPFQICTA